MIVEHPRGLASAEWLHPVDPRPGQSVRVTVDCLECGKSLTNVNVFHVDRPSLNRTGHFVTYPRCCPRDLYRITVETLETP